MGRTLLFAAILIGAAAISACSGEAPPCPDTRVTAAAKSAGCLVLKHQQLLMVIDHTGKLSVPGGGSDGVESPQCTAHRETWEETGIDTRPAALVRVFENGFHLYHCELHPASAAIDPPRRLEIQQALWLSPQQFKHYSWRFPEEQAWLEQWMSLATSPDPQRND